MRHQEEASPSFSHPWTRCQDTAYALNAISDKNEDVKWSKKNMSPFRKLRADVG
jgi:hypothetical protein